MHHRPVTRSMTERARQRGGVKREASRETQPQVPKRKQQRRTKKQAAKEPVDNAEQKFAEDGVVLLSDQEQKSELQIEVGYEVLLWGDGTMGQLGPVVGPTDDPDVVLPKLLPLKTSVLEVAAGGMHTLLLMSDGSVQSFGSNDEGALGRKTVGDVWDVETAEDATMEQSKPADVVLPEGATAAKGVQCTDCGSFVWTADGRIFGCGAFRSSDGLIGFSENVRIQKLPSCVYKPRTAKKAVMKLVTGGNHVLALLKDGSVLSWGDGERGQLGRPLPTGDISAMLTPTEIPAFEGVSVVDVFAGESASFFVTISGDVFACGLNASAQLGIAPSTEPVPETCPTAESSVERKELFLEPTRVDALSSLDVKIQQLSSGKRHTLMLTDDGEVYSFGASIYGALGRPSDEERLDALCPTPQKISGLDEHSIAQISAGQDCSACLDDAGRLLTFGGEHSGLTCVGFDGDDLLTPHLLKRGDATKTWRFDKVALGGHHGVLLGRKRADPN